MPRFIAYKPTQYNSNNPDTSSVGHIFHNFLTGFILSKLSNYELLYEPISNDSVRFESFLNFNSLFKTPDVSQLKQYRLPVEFCSPTTGYAELSDQQHLDYLNKILDELSPLNDNCLVVIGRDRFPGKLTEHYNLVKSDLQKAYWSKTRNYPERYDRDMVNVAIHIRRGDITKQRNLDRWLENDHYVDIINNIRKNIPNVLFHVFSQGEEKDFKEFHNEKVIFHLNGSDTNALNDMCFSDILVTGQSTFSILASYLNKNITIYTPLKDFMYNWGDDKVYNYKNINFDKINKFLCHREI
jgi:hypothetical protein